MYPQKVADPKEDFCGTAYAARVLGLSVGTIQSLVEKNELRAWKTNGGHWRIAMDSLLDYQKRNNVKSASPSGTADRLKVLVVDDDPIARELLSTCLAMWDLPIDFTVMSSAFEALIDLSRIQPDVLITDLRMPGMDGFELLRTLRQNPVFNNTHLLAITGMDADEIKEKGGLPDRTVCKQKPIDMSWLNGYLVALLSQRSYPRST